MSFAPIYISINDVKDWLIDKVSFTSDPTQGITDTFLGTLTAYSEQRVCNLLNRFYTIPLVTLTGGPFTSLPQETQIFLSELFVLKSVMTVLEEEFGRNSANINENYYKQIKYDYDTQMAQVYSRDPQTKMFRAVLPGLQINKFAYTGNTMSQTPRVVGIVRGTSDNMRYALNQVVKPAKTWWDFEGDGGPPNVSDISDQ